jgi:uncharacterized coiled-coil protein SlyX
MSMTTEPGGAGLLGVRAAAKVLKLSPSTVTRYLQDHPSLNLGNETRPKVDVAALREHRAENVDPARRGSHAGRLYGEVKAGPPEAAGATSAKAVLLRARAARETTMAQTARVDLDVKKKLLVPLAEIETGVVDAGMVLKNALLELGSRVAEQLSNMEEPREIAALLEAEHRRALQDFRAALDAMANKLRAENPDLADGPT